MVDFAGWSMPVQYASIIDEHRLTRASVGLFDISHMARFEFTGQATPAWLDSLCTRRINNLADGQVRYSLLCNERAGVLDDVLVTKLPSSASPRYLMVANAGNREKIYHWLQAHMAAGVQFVDRSDATAMIALQGPNAWQIAESGLGLVRGELRYYFARLDALDGSEVIVSRTGYTGEDGCELILPSDQALSVWKKLVEAAQTLGGGPVGLGARDTLRLEAGMPLYGHELSEDITPWQAGLEFAVTMQGRDFIGRDALAAQTADTATPYRVGFRLHDKRIARQGAAVLMHGEPIGEVTSGAFCPTLSISAGMAYVDRRRFAGVQANPASQIGLQVDIRGKLADAEFLAMPFYKRA